MFFVVVVHCYYFCWQKETVWSLSIINILCLSMWLNLFGLFFIRFSFLFRFFCHQHKMCTDIYRLFMVFLFFFLNLNIQYLLWPRTQNAFSVRWKNCIKQSAAHSHFSAVSHTAANVNNKNLIYINIFKVCLFRALVLLENAVCAKSLSLYLSYFKWNAMSTAIKFNKMNTLKMAHLFGGGCGCIYFMR